MTYSSTLSAAVATINAQTDVTAEVGRPDADKGPVRFPSCRVYLREVVPGQALMANTSSPAYRQDVLYIDIVTYVRGATESALEVAALDTAQDILQALETYHVAAGHSGLHLERYTPLVSVGAQREGGLIRTSRLEIKVFTRSQRGRRGE